ncbi:MAG: hypothetical protein TREMPRED_003872 [Tremellales sp. Tagirdzhanova-0007]|nr:MAG: hypothetical protein TREMPRED_003872 [Tremellales sp. Tagirdzhanova-0007]
MTYEYDRCPPRAIEQLILDGLEFQRPSIEALRSLISTKISSEPASTATCPIPHSKGIALGYPWKWLRDEYGRIIGEYSLHPDPPDDLTLEDMMRLPPERQEWDLGYGLEPDYHRKGITTDVLRVMLDDWVRHWMHIGKVNAGHEGDNAASRRIMIMLKFTLVRQKVVDWPDGGRREIWSYERVML